MQLISFAKKLVLFSIPIILLLISIYGTLIEADFYPLVTNSPSLDAKLLDLRSHKFKNIDVLSIGSSMNLNNLNSSEMKLSDNLKYYNFGSWGLQISDTLYFVKYFTNTYKLKCVVVSSSVPDFTERGNISIPSYSELDLVNNYLPYFYIKSNLLSIFYRHRTYKQYKASSNDYTNLNFDDSGGVALNIPEEKISKDRWNAKLGIPTNNTEFQYNELRELTLYLKKKNIIFVYAQSPIRKALLGSCDSNAIIQAHFNKCKSIVDGNGGHYINLHNPTIFGDSLFVDQYHLSSVGSKIYTKQISAKIVELLNK